MKIVPLVQVVFFGIQQLIYYYFQHNQNYGSKLKEIIDVLWKLM